MIEIGFGCKVCMDFSLRLADGTVVESSDDGEPLEFVMGDGTLARGLELALLGLRPGAHQCLSIGAEDAFGTRDPDRVGTLPAERFAGLGDLEIDQIVGFETDTGEELAGRIVGIDEQGVTVDLNHPLAGHEITFEVDIRSVEPAPDVE